VGLAWSAICNGFGAGGCRDCEGNNGDDIAQWAPYYYLMRCLQNKRKSGTDGNHREDEAHVRYVKNWFTIPNIKCKEQWEIESERREATERRQ
jgi:hypothetical protein